jgi:hypothetical protein
MVDEVFAGLRAGSGHVSLEDFRLMMEDMLVQSGEAPEKACPAPGEIDGTRLRKGDVVSTVDRQTGRRVRGVVITLGRWALVRATS